MKYECVFLLVLGCIGTVSTYQCYQCTSAIDSTCADWFTQNGKNASQKVEAGPGEVCVKTKRNDLIDRTAVASARCIGGTNGCTSATQGGVSTTLCCCKTNLCNGVSMVREHSLIIFIAMSALTIFVCQWF